MEEEIEEEMSSTSFTREELYRLVWSKPMTQAAAELGLSDKGLAKICDRFQVPYPYRGYWAMLAGGKKPARYRLQTTKGEVDKEVTIRPTLPKEPRRRHLSRSLSRPLLSHHRRFTSRNV